MISAIVLTKNSAKTIERCLRSLDWCDEIIIIDDYSTDKTLKVAKKHKVKIYKRKLEGDFAAQRNFGLTKAKGEWVLFLDSDETVSKIKIPKGNYSGFYIKRRDYWKGQEIKFGETNIKLLRLAKRNSGRWKRKIHEYWDVKGEIGELKNNIKHYPHPTVHEFIDEIKTYSQIHAKQNQKEGKRASLLKVLVYPRYKFKYNFLIKGGFRDGIHGFVIACIMSFHSFLAWSELWLMSRKKNY